MNEPQESSQMTTEKAGQELLVPRPSYGAFVWPGLIVVGVFSSPRVFFVDVLSCVLLGSACVWWFIISRKRFRRSNFLLRFLGYIAFGFGISMFQVGAKIAILGIARKVSAVEISVVFIISLGVAVGLIAGAYGLVFGRENKTVA